MKHILNFNEWLNEAKLNEQSPDTVDADSPDNYEDGVLDWIQKTLGAKSLKEICVLDEDEPTHPKAQKTISEIVTDWEENEDFEDDDWEYSKKYNVIAKTSQGYVLYFLLVKDLKKYDK